MHQYYGDILERVSEQPQWFDEHAVPRFCAFSPQRLASIYAREAALVLIRCQSCNREFAVAFSELNLRHALWSDDHKTKIKTIGDLIEEGSLHYGDPPNVRCCPAGPTMNSEPVRVLEYWYRPVVRGEGIQPGTRRVTDLGAMTFKRDPTLERPLKRLW